MSQMFLTNYPGKYNFKIILKDFKTSGKNILYYYSVQELLEDNFNIKPKEK